MAKSNERKAVERLHLMLADALYNALPTDTVETVRTRVLRDATEGEREALEALIADKRTQYAPASELVEDEVEEPA